LRDGGDEDITEIALSCPLFGGWIEHGQPTQFTCGHDVILKEFDLPVFHDVALDGGGLDCVGESVHDYS
jgi:hypothetical protein